IYQFDDTVGFFNMKIDSNEYFSLVFPGFLMMCIGMYLIPTKIFHTDSVLLSYKAKLNENFFKYIYIFCFLLGLSVDLMGDSLRFIVYLLSLLTYVAAFALFAGNPRKNRYWLVGILLWNLISSLRSGMYHDLVIWIVFSVLFSFYVLKLSQIKKILLFSLIVLMVLLVQKVKLVSREVIWNSGIGYSQAVVSSAEIGQSNLGTDSLFSTVNLVSSLNRINQGWIFASTVNNLNRYNNFQGMTIMELYFKSALLPRFLAPNKLRSGSNEIFNEFSGHTINKTTSMGLGIFADGYVAYGKVGVIVFCFFFGLLFSFTFWIVGRWSRIDPAYILLIIPLLIYSCRPDCELQTVLNHLFKGILLYGFLVTLTKYRFVLQNTVKSEL
ncbi:MAG: hypothetical protein RL582_342, partial [Bacteroidota bacterium]